MIAASSRLRDQGFVNHYRKFILRLLAVALAAYLFYVPSPWDLSATSAALLQASGSLLMFAGIVGRVFATLSIGGRKDQTIIRTELYSLCRNPLYFSSFLMTIGFGLVTGRVDFTVVAAAAYLAVFYPMMLNEARFLKARFPEYGEYENSVPLFIPDFSRWQARETFEINCRLVFRTLLDAAIALPVTALVLLLMACI
jgi:protein-S-isoprenylcysteine O-methyltransferase Ste14